MDANRVSARLLVLAATMLIAGTTNGAIGQETVLKSKYSISYLGINVGEMKNTIKVSATSYEISGKAKANSVVSLVANAKASFSSTGKITANRLIPIAQDIRYSSGKKKGRLKLAFSGGSVSDIHAKPKIKYKRGAIPVQASHLEQVVDPVSSLIFPVRPGEAGDGNRVCNRVLPVFDGRSRMNLVFAYKSSAAVSVEGFSGTTFTCSVRYQPVAGIRPKKKNIRFMKENRDMEVTMARIGDRDAYALFSFRVRTNDGMATGSAIRFESD